MPLSPKRVMHRKVQRGREKGNATRDNYIDFGEIALVAMEPTWLSARKRQTSDNHENRL